MVVGFVFAFLVSFWCFVVAAVSLAITATYLTVGKRSGLPGNFLVSACVAIPFIYGSIVAVGTVGLNVVLVCIHGFPVQHRQRNHQRHRRHQRRQR